MKSFRIHSGLIILIFLISMGSSAALINRNTTAILKENFENDNRVIAGLVSNDIEKSLIRPITVSEIMAQDQRVRTLMSASTPEEAAAMETAAVDLLGSMQDTYGYSIVFVISESSRACFTPEGIADFIDPENDPADLWYQTLLDYARDCKVEVVVNDTINREPEDSLSVFINQSVYDEQDQLIGICGVAMDMAELQRLLTHYERIYNIDIAAVGATGLILVDTDTQSISQDYVHIEHLSDYADGELYYEIREEGDRTIIYLDNPDWFLIVQANETSGANIDYIWFPGLISTLIGLALIALTEHLYYRRLLLPRMPGNDSR